MSANQNVKYSRTLWSRCSMVPSEYHWSVSGQCISSVLPTVGVNTRFVLITDTESVSIGDLWQLLN